MLTALLDQPRRAIGQTDSGSLDTISASLLARISPLCPRRPFRVQDRISGFLRYTVQLELAKPLCLALLALSSSPASRALERRGPG